MRIDQITLKNYRCFDELRVDFHPQVTVLVALNGHGKTTVLDAVKVALWPFVAGFDMGSTTNDVTGIHIDDVRREQVRTLEMDWRLPASISANGFIRVEQLIQEGKLLPGPRDWPEPDCMRPWGVHRSREKIKKGTKTKDIAVMGEYDRHEGEHGFTLVSTYETSLKVFAEHLQRRIFSEQSAPPDELPMLGFYGTGRLWAQKKLTMAHEESNPETQSRTFAYRDCLDPASSYKHFAIWFRRAFRSLRDAQIQRLEKGQLMQASDIDLALTAPVRAIQKATDILLRPHTGWHTLEYSAEYDELVLNHDSHGKLMVSQLSDGIRNMLAMVGDIAYRCYKLNAHWGEDAPKKTHGIVMIDEVDMHLHPSWQQTVLNELSEAFPKLQFIVTTHSPQVLSTIRRENIRVLNGSSAEQPAASTYGQPSGDVMHSVMLVDSQPPIEEKQQIDRLTVLVDQGHWGEAEAQGLLQQLTQTLGPENARLQQLLRSIARQKILKGLNTQ